MGSKEAFLPTLEDVNTPLSKDQLAVLRKQLLREGDLASVQSRFNYAWGLIKSDKEDDQQLGVKILTEIFKDIPSRRRECLYYLAVGSYKLGNYSEARRYTESLLDHEPGNSQALALQEMIKSKVSKESLVGIAVASSFVALSATALGLLIKAKRR